MVKTGIQRKSKKQQQISAELETIVEEFGQALRNANKRYIGEQLPGLSPRFTSNMYYAWNRYVDFCRENPNA